MKRKTYLMLCMLILSLCFGNGIISNASSGNTASVVDVMEYLDDPSEIIDKFSLQQNSFDDPDALYYINEEETVAILVKNDKLIKIGSDDERVSFFGLKAGDKKEDVNDKLKQLNSFFLLNYDGYDENFPYIAVLYNSRMYIINPYYENDSLTYWQIYGKDGFAELLGSSGESTCTCLQAILDAQETHGTVYSDEWKTALLEYIVVQEMESEGGNEFDTTYNFADINGDGVSELYCKCISEDVSWEDIAVGTLNDDSVESVRGDAGLSSYIEGENLIYTCEVQLTETHERIYKIENGRFTLAAEGVKKDDGTLYWDDNVVSESEYDQMLKEVYDVSKAKKFDDDSMNAAEAVQKIVAMGNASADESESTEKDEDKTKEDSKNESEEESNDSGSTGIIIVIIILVLVVIIVVTVAIIVTLKDNKDNRRYEPLSSRNQKRIEPAAFNGQRTVNERQVINESKAVQEPPGYVQCLSGSVAGYAFKLTSNSTLNIGRDAKRANLVLNEKFISGVHCSIQYNSADKTYIVTDHSTNGTFINGIRLQKDYPVACQPGTIVLLGNEGVQILLGQMGIQRI